MYPVYDGRAGGVDGVRGVSDDAAKRTLVSALGSNNATQPKKLEKSKVDIVKREAIIPVVNAKIPAAISASRPTTSGTPIKSEIKTLTKIKPADSSLSAYVKTSLLSPVPKPQSSQNAVPQSVPAKRPYHLTDLTFKKTTETMSSPISKAPPFTTQRQILGDIIEPTSNTPNISSRSTGFRNLGSTCYIASVLQLLFYSPLSGTKI